MADEKDNNNAKDDQQGSEPPKSSLKLVVILLSTLLLLLIGAIAAYFILFSGDDAAPTAEQGQVEDIEESQEEEIVPPKNREVRKVDPETLPAPALYFEMVPEFVINLAPESEQSYLVVKISLMTRDESILEIIKANNPLLRSLIIETLTSKVSQDLRSFDGKKKLKQEILTQLQQFIRQESGVVGVEQILFTHFIME